MSALIVVDTLALHQALREKMFRIDWNAREVAALLGFHPQVLTNIKLASRAAKPYVAYQPSSAIFLTLCWWLDRNPMDFALRPDGRPL